MATSPKAGMCTLEIGTEVGIEGLDTRKYNGLLGHVTEFDASSGRYNVQVLWDGSTKILGLKRVNLWLRWPHVKFLHARASQLKDPQFLDGLANEECLAIVDNHVILDQVHAGFPSLRSSYPISQSMCDILTNGIKPESSRKLKKGRLQTFATAQSFELKIGGANEFKGDEYHCEPMTLHAVGPECFFNFAANAWQSNACKGLYDLRAVDVVYVAFCPAGDGKLFLKLGFWHSGDASKGDHPAHGTPNRIVNYLTKKKSLWKPDNCDTGVFTFLTPMSTDYVNKGRATENDLKTFLLNANNLHPEVCDAHGCFCKTASGEYLFVHLPRSGDVDMLLGELTARLCEFTGERHLHPHRVGRGCLGCNANRGRGDAFCVTPWHTPVPMSHHTTCLICNSCKPRSRSPHRS